MATTWTISTLERELADGGVVVAHWRAIASETVGTGDDAELTAQARMEPLALRLTLRRPITFRMLM